MFGKNPIRSLESDPASLAVQEVFYTIQGEGPYSGQPATFIRLAGCNLACTYCDTEFESNIGNRLTPSAIVSAVHLNAQVAKYPSAALQLVVLTGGEPLRQDCSKLVAALLEAGVKHVQIETAGTLWREELLPFIASHKLDIVCSPKTPKIHPMIMRYCHHFKYVIEKGRTSPEDGLPVGGTQVGNWMIAQRIARPWDIEEHELVPNTTVWVSPCDAHDPTGLATNNNVLEAVKIAMRYGYRLSLQTHKMVGLQ